jgi:hypothetical protein
MFMDFVRDLAKSPRKVASSITIVTVPAFIMILYQVIYLQNILDNKPVSKSLENYYSGITMFNIVTISLGLLGVMFEAMPIRIKVFLLILYGGNLALLLYMYIIINKGEHPSRGAILTNLILLYALIAIGFIILGLLLGAVFAR